MGDKEQFVKGQVARQGLSRRQFLKVIGAGAVGALVAPSLWFLRGGAGSSENQVGEAEEYKRPRRWAMVIALGWCDGCRSLGKPPQCTQACIEGRFAPEPQEWIEVYEFDLHGGGTQFVPTPCMQCQNAPCVHVCPVGATWSTPEGVVLIDQERCIGCRLCMAACPYDRRFFNWGQPPIPKEALFVKYSPERQMPARKGTVMKCDFCPDVARAGRVPFCILGCPNRAIYWGDLEEDLATNGLRVVKFSQFLATNEAYRLKEELNTRPRVYYIPGHGQQVGRHPYETGRIPTTWPWVEKIEGARAWSRSKGEGIGLWNK